MSSELDRVIWSVQQGIDVNKERGEEPFISFSNDRVNDLLSLLTELKSRRAQQSEPPAGCAELAGEIALRYAKYTDKDTFARCTSGGNETAEEFERSWKAHRDAAVHAAGGVPGAIRGAAGKYRRTAAH